MALLRILLLLVAALATALPAATATAQSSRNALDALQSLGNDLLGDDQPEFLTPDEAFQLSSSVTDDGRLQFDWNIAEGYYLYRERISFKPDAQGGAQIGTPELPKGKLKQDDYFGEMEVYYVGTKAKVPVSGHAGGPLDVQVTYQGCADAGLCYPPVIKKVAFELPGAGGSATGSAAAAGGAMAAAGAVAGTETAPSVAALTPVQDLPEQDRLAASLAGGYSLTLLATFFGLGLLLTFTPCVLPMVPILSSIIAGQGEEAGTRRGFVLSLIYVLAMALTYTALGVAAGLTGAGLAAAFQDPWVLGALALVFVALAVSMFGFYDLALPSGVQSWLTNLSGRQRGGTYAGVGIMGFLSALVVSPCVAAPLAAALIYIGQTGDAVLGGLALFSLSLGMGAPLLLIGAFGGALLPKAGAWMDRVKAVFGVVMLAMAIYLIERVVPGWVTLGLSAALLIVSAIYMGALDSLTESAGGWRRLWKGAGLVMMVYGVLLMVGASNGSDNLLRPLEGFAGRGGEARERELQFQRVKGTEGLQAALAAPRPRAAPSCSTTTPTGA